MPDVFFRRDFPVLLAIAKWDLDGREGHFLGVERLGAKLPTGLSLSAPELFLAVNRLVDGGYVDAARMSTFGWQDFEIRGLQERGLREVGAWPQGEDLATGLARVLETEARTMERTEPEKGRKVRTILTAMGDLGTDFAAKLAAELLKGLPR